MGTGTIFDKSKKSLSLKQELSCICFPFSPVFWARVVDHLGILNSSSKLLLVGHCVAPLGRMLELVYGIESFVVDTVVPDIDNKGFDMRAVSVPQKKNYSTPNQSLTDFSLIILINALPQIKPLNSLFVQLNSLLKEDGTLLVADYFADGENLEQAKIQEKFASIMSDDSAGLRHIFSIMEIAKNNFWDLTEFFDISENTHQCLKFNSTISDGYKVNKHSLNGEIGSKRHGALKFVERSLGRKYILAAILVLKKST